MSHQHEKDQEVEAHMDSPTQLGEQATASEVAPSTSAPLAERLREAGNRCIGNNYSRWVAELLFEAADVLPQSTATASDKLAALLENTKRMGEVVNAGRHDSTVQRFPAPDVAKFLEMGKAAAGVTAREDLGWFAAQFRAILDGFFGESRNGVICSIPDGGLNTPTHRTWCQRCRKRWMKFQALVRMLESASAQEVEAQSPAAREAGSAAAIPTVAEGRTGETHDHLQAQIEALQSLSAKWRQSGHWWKCQGGNTFEMEAHVRAGETFLKCADELDAALGVIRQSADQERQELFTRVDGQTS